MTQERKELILKDICGRIPYETIVQISLFRDDGRRSDIELDPHVTENIWEIIDKYHALPYLRSMSSMTEEEEKEYRNIDNRSYSCPKDYAHIPASERIDWLNSRHFDYRGLIPKGLAIEAPNDMYEI